MILIDRYSGQLVQVRYLHLPQKCGICGDGLQFAWGMSVEDGRGWTCLAHERRLMALDMSERTRARNVASAQLAGAQTGDVVRVTPELLAAVAP